jgi:hypothetical protein
MNNPKFMAALSSMQSNPKAFEKLKEEEPEVMEFVREFCGVMGEHFCKLGEEQEKYRKSSDGAKEERVREVGVLEERAMRKHREELQNQQASNLHDNYDSQDTRMDEHVSTVLSNPQLRSMLMDPKMQYIMEECSNGNKLHYYMRDEEIGPKLRMLVEAGLLRFA